MTYEQFRTIVENYEGKIVEDTDLIYIESINEICNYYESGEVATRKKVLCKVGIRQGSLFGEETTYSILGGFFGGIPSETSIESALQQFGFKKKTVEQATIFDLM